MFSLRHILASALLGLAAATTHSTDGLLASETSAALATGTAPPPGASVPPGMVMTHIVQVGGPNGSLTFSPENVIAAPGDLVQFQFYPKNHSVVQSTFDQPCVPIQNIMPNKTDAFYSGFMPSDPSAVAAGNVTTYTIRVMDTKPIWYYCSQGQHCQNGMVGAINAVATGNKTMQSFKALAASAPENLSPGQAPGSVQQPPADGGAEESAAGGGASVTDGAAATGTVANAPAEATINAAGRVSQSFFGLAGAAFVAFVVL